MIERIQLRNFGPIGNLDWSQLGQINLVIGPNGCGKSFLLKAAYASIKTIEQHRRGDDPREIEAILREKLFWTFQPAARIGDLVGRGAEGLLELQLETCQGQLRFAFGRDAEARIEKITSTIPSTATNSIFLPAKEILSLHQVILQSRERDQVFGFDDTYLDLARALRQPPTKGRNHAAIVTSRKSLEDVLGGKVKLDEAGRWWFSRDGERFPMGTTAEGVKKIAILETLLGNRYLSPDSIVFIDEPESALHPVALIRFLEIIAALAATGMQFFLASHSYFVIKKLFLIAREQNLRIPTCSLGTSAPMLVDLREEMPENDIVQASIRLYEEEIGLRQ